MSLKIPSSIFSYQKVLALIHLKSIKSLHLLIFLGEKNLGLYYISFKQRTKKEVVTYLLDHDIPNFQIAKIIDELTASRFIDDDAYAASFIRGKVLGKSSGPYQIRQKLTEKGIDKELVLDKLDELFDFDTQVEVATHLAEKLVMTKYSRLPLKALKMKISTHLTSKDSPMTSVRSHLIISS